MPPNITTFSIIIGVLAALVEVYVIGHWTSYVRREKRHPWLYIIVWIVSAIMMAMYWYIVYRRHFFRMAGPEIILFGIVSFWVVPKLFIAAWLLVKDIAKGLYWLVKKIRSLLKTPSQAPSKPPVTKEQTERRAFLSKAGWTLTAVPYVYVGMGIWKTIYDFRVYEEEIRLPNLPKSMDGFRIVQISDVHAGSFPDHKPFQEVRRIVESLKGDAVVITGDFVNTLPDELKLIAGDLAGLAAHAPLYASLGNHDHYHTPAQHRILIDGIRELGVDLLVNEHRLIGSGANRIVLAGTDNTGFKQEFAELKKALRGTHDDDAIVLLAHDPTFWDKEVVGTKVGLMLAGHTHGGQFGVQLGNFEWSPANMVYKQSAGRYTRGEQTLYVIRGIGTVGPPMRLGIQPEITVITLRA